MLFIGILWASVGRLSRPFGNVCIRQTKVASVWPEQTEQTKQTSFGKMVLYNRPLFSAYHVACQLYRCTGEGKKTQKKYERWISIEHMEIYGTLPGQSHWPISAQRRERWLDLPDTLPVQPSKIAHGLPEGNVHCSAKRPNAYWLPVCPSITHRDRLSL